MTCETYKIVVSASPQGREFIGTASCIRACLPDLTSCAHGKTKAEARLEAFDKLNEALAAIESATPTLKRRTG